MNPLLMFSRRRFFGLGPATVSCVPLGQFLAAAAEAATAEREREHPALRGAAEQAFAELEAQGPRLLNVAPMEGQFLNLLVRAVQARSVLEIGTAFGYSALWIATALEETDGRLTTLEIRPERVAAARARARQANLERRITFQEGDAHAVVDQLEGPFDFVFLDADKDGLVDYFEKLDAGKLAPGALWVAHEAIRMREWMLDFMERIQQRPDYTSVIVSVLPEDGFLVSYRTRTRTQSSNRTASGARRQGKPGDTRRSDR